MTRDKLTDYDGVTASNNTDIGGVSIAEGMLPSNVNNSMRELTKQLGAFADGTDGVDVLKLQDDTDTNSIKLQAPSSVTADTTFTMPDGDGSADQVLKTDGAGQLGWVDQTAVAANPNLIINGAMTIDQRNGGGSITPTSGQYSVDRLICLQSAASKYSIQQNAGSVTPPSGFVNYAGVTSLSAYSVSAGDQFYVAQRIEANNLSHLGWGTSDAKTVTLSFWVRSSLTGTFGGSIVNAPTFNYSYPFSYTISSANTWEHKTVTIEGPTSGTWATSGNGTGLQLAFGLGVGSTFSGTANAWASALYYAPTGATSVVGTSGATFYITGVKLEVGSSSTSFIHEDIGTTLEKCQRYYETGITGAAGGLSFGNGYTGAMVSYNVIKCKAAQLNSSSVTATNVYGGTINLGFAGGTAANDINGFCHSCVNGAAAVSYVFTFTANSEL
jgi:hypothetical protein